VLQIKSIFIILQPTNREERGMRKTKDEEDKDDEDNDEERGERERER
jgi:hypothetical protein